jgi:hypothetical protein
LKEHLTQPDGPKPPKPKIDSDQLPGTSTTTTTTTTTSQYVSSNSNEEAGEKCNELWNGEKRRFKAKKRGGADEEEEGEAKKSSKRDNSGSKLPKLDSKSCKKNQTKPQSESAQVRRNEGTQIRRIRPNKFDLANYFSVKWASRSNLRCLCSINSSSFFITNLTIFHPTPTTTRFT